MDPEMLKSWAKLFPAPVARHMAIGCSNLGPSKNELTPPRVFFIPVKQASTFNSI